MHIYEFWLVTAQPVVVRDLNASDASLMRSKYSIVNARGAVIVLVKYYYIVSSQHMPDLLCILVCSAVEK